MSDSDMALICACAFTVLFSVMAYQVGYDRGTSSVSQSCLNMPTDTDLIREAAKEMGYGHSVHLESFNSGMTWVYVKNPQRKDSKPIAVSKCEPLSGSLSLAIDEARREFQQT